MVHQCIAEKADHTVSFFMARLLDDIRALPKIVNGFNVELYASLLAHVVYSNRCDANEAVYKGEANWSALASLVRTYTNSATGSLTS